MPAGSGRDRRTRKEAMMRLRTLFAVGGSAIVLGAAVLVAQPAFAATASAGHYTAKNREYNGTVAAGSSVTFGWVASGTGSPTNCRINGGSCSGGGGGGPDTSPPSVPTGLRVTGVTTSSISLAWNAS